jgi:omega-6 fatty acid desaturase (delta-12 desaturase)
MFANDVFLVRRKQHGKHHAHTGHLTEDQVFVPKTRSTHPYNIPKFDSENENIEGSRVSNKVQKELFDALGDSPISATLWSTAQLVLGWPLYLTLNSSGQKWYPKRTNRKLMFSRCVEMDV